MLDGLKTVMEDAFHGRILGAEFFKFTNIFLLLTVS